MAVDDIGNFRYTSFVDNDAVAVPVYVEAEPAFVAAEKEGSERDDTLERPFSISSLPDDAPLPTTTSSGREHAVPVFETRGRTSNVDSLTVRFIVVP